jgi:NhaA family Na+:H+ antiporter
MVNNPDATSGWGIPMATDIAIALGAIALLGKRVPSGLKVMLLAIAIVDDIGSILVIALFYTSTISIFALFAVAGLLILMSLLNYFGIRSMFVYILLSIIAWIFASKSGVHPTILGVVLGFMTPWQPWYSPQFFPEIANKLITRIKDNLKIKNDDPHNDKNDQALMSISSIASESVAPLQRIEKILLPWSAFLIVPIFAFVNAGINITGGALSSSLNSSVTYAIAFGLFFGKPIGITLGAWIAVKMGSTLPRGVNFMNIFGMGIIAGIGFTVALFITELAYVDEFLLRDAKIGILIASFFAAFSGIMALKLMSNSSN